MILKVPFTNYSITVGKTPQEKAQRAVIPVGNRTGVERDLSGFKLSFSGLFTSYRNQSDVYSCIREWRENVGLAGWKLKFKGDDEREVPEAILKEIQNIFNFWGSWRKLKSRIVRDLGVTGNAFLYITRNIGGTVVLGFEVIDPRTMTIISDKLGNIIEYVQRIGQAVQHYEPSEIIHLSLDSDPTHELWGLSPMEPIIWEARTDLQAMMSNYYFFENGGLPAAQYILDTGLSKEAQEKVVAFLREEIRGAKNNNKGFVLQGVKEVKNLNITQRDMEFLGGRRFTTEKICAAYGVPKFLLGYTEDANYSNGITMMAKFYESTIQPLEELIAEVFTEFLARIGLPDYEFVFNVQTFDEEAAIEERALRLYQNGAMTLRQLKKMTNREITKEDEAQPNFDAYILQSGASATLLEDVGVDPMLADGNTAVAQNLLTEMKKLNAKTY